MDRQKRNDTGRQVAPARWPKGEIPDNSLGAVIREVIPMFLVVAALIAVIDTVLGILHII